MASWQAIRITKEATPGTFNASATAADKAHIRLTENSAFPTQPAAIYWTVRGAEGSNRPAQTGTAQFNTAGKLTTLFYPSQAKLLMDWATALGGTYPALIPQSVTIDHIQQTEDPSFTLRYRRFLGCYVQNMNLTSNNPGAASRAKLEFDILFLDYVDTITVTDFPTPAQADYPQDQPYGFQEAGAGFILGTARTSFSMLNLSVKNILRAVYDESALPQVIRWCGRDISLATNFRFKNLTDRAAFEAQTALDCSVAFTDETTTTTFDFQSQARINQFSRDQPLDNVPRTPLSVMGYLDPASNTDLTVTVTP
jgi:hypothetical protein